MCWPLPALGTPPTQADLGEAEGHRVTVLGNLSWLHTLGHCSIHQSCTVHVHPQPVTVCKPTDLGVRGAAGLGGTPGASGATMSHALSSGVPMCRAQLPTPGRTVPAPSVGSHLPEIGERQYPASRRAVRVLQTDELRTRVVPAAVRLTDGQLQLVQVECAIRQIWQCLGVDTGDLCPGQGRVWS